MQFLHHLMKKYFSELDLVLFRFLTYSGLRGAEASALEWSDINFTDKTVTVDKNMSLTKSGFVVSTPKTKSAYRTITSDAKTLKQRIRDQIAPGADLGHIDKKTS